MAGNFIILEVTEVGGRIGPFKAPLGAGLDATRYLLQSLEIQISFSCSNNKVWLVVSTQSSIRPVERFIPLTIT